MVLDSLDNVENDEPVKMPKIAIKHTYLGVSVFGYSGIFFWVNMLKITMLRYIVRSWIHLAQFDYFGSSGSAEVEMVLTQPLLQRWEIEGGTFSIENMWFITELHGFP